MSDEIKLLPCPFCGRKAYMKNISNGYSSSMFTKRAEVGCSECKIHLTGESAFEVSENMNIYVLEDGIGEMIVRWNTRKAGDKDV